MADLLNSNELRILFYLGAAVACWVAGRRERAFLPGSGLDLWPTFWSLSALLLVAMALGRATDLAGYLTQVGRKEALDSGWYDARRPIQAALVGTVSIGWFISVMTAIWRVPERRRRYLPEAICIFSLICFAAVRMVSFHYADAILYNNPILGVRIGSIIELTFAGLAVGAGLYRVRLPGRARPLVASESLAS